MGWENLVTGVFILASIYGLSKIHTVRTKQKIVDYRRRYLDVVARFDAIVKNLHDIELLCHPQTPADLLNRYQKNLDLLQFTLGQVAEAPKLGKEPFSLNMLSILIIDFESMVRKTLLDFKIQHKSILEKKPSNDGCFFCSRPYLSSIFHDCLFRIKGQVISSFVCQMCVIKIENERNVPMLCFHNPNGTRVHWSKNRDYQPIRDFWALKSHNNVAYYNVAVTLLSR
ncbi:MAG: hypothetical protein AB7T49_02795 [Oligoflexales bacterium]